MSLVEEPGSLLHERLMAVEAICADQKAQIDGLTKAFSDLLAANVALNKDLRLCTFLSDAIDSDLQKEKEGGTPRTAASYFGARAELFINILSGAYSSQVFDHYWFRSVFWSNEKRQRDELEKLRKAIELKLKF
ncbi:MAG: hypothetical protein ACEQSU_05710 [Microgenomates group bacterium]